MAVEAAGRVCGSQGTRHDPYNTPNSHSLLPCACADPWLLLLLLSLPLLLCWHATTVCCPQVPAGPEQDRGESQRLADVLVV